jgi:hypothetical protein
MVMACILFIHSRIFIPSFHEGRKGGWERGKEGGEETVDQFFSNELRRPSATESPRVLV